jgi:hypothetical protein
VPVCRGGIAFGNNSRILRDFFPILPGMFSVFDRPWPPRVISQIGGWRDVARSRSGSPPAGREQ